MGCDNVIARGVGCGFTYYSSAAFAHPSRRSRPLSKMATTPGERGGGMRFRSSEPSDRKTSRRFRHGTERLPTSHQEWLPQACSETLPNTFACSPTPKAHPREN